MQWNGIISSLRDILHNFAVCGVYGVRFRGSGEIDDALGKSEFAFRQPDELEGLLGIERDAQGIVVCETNVFGRKPNQTSRHIQRIFAGFEAFRFSSRMAPSRTSRSSRSLTS